MDRSLLQSVYLFKAFTEQELSQIIAIAEPQTFSAGETIFLRGDAARALYLIKYGSVRIQQTTSTGDNIDVATLGSGSHFGEMALLDGETRSASAVASEKTELLILPYDKLRILLDQNTELAVKFYRELAHFLCGRLRVTTNDLSFARERNLSHF